MEDRFWLIVDPDRNASLRLAQIVRRLVKRVHTVSAGDGALQFLLKNPLGGVFCELQLPDGPGLTFLADARRIQPGLPVVVVTAKGSMEDTIDAFRSGVSDFIVKPVSQSAVAIAWQRMCNSTARGKELAVAQTTDAPEAEATAQTISVSVNGSLKHIEQQVVREVIYRLDGNKAAAARALGIHRKTLYRLLEP